MFLPNMILSISSVASILLSKTLLIKSSSNRVSLSTSSLTFSLTIISSLSNSYYHVSVFQSNKIIIKNELFFLHLDNHTQYSSFEYIIFILSYENFFVFTYHVVQNYIFSSCSSSKHPYSPKVSFAAYNPTADTSQLPFQVQYLLQKHMSDYPCFWFQYALLLTITHMAKYPFVLIQCIYFFIRTKPRTPSLMALPPPY